MEDIMLGAMHVPSRTFEWLNAKLTDRARHELRVILRGLERACEAAATVLWTEDAAMAQVVVQVVGDDTSLPDRRRLPRLERSQPTRETWLDAGGNAHDVVVFKIAMGGAVPRMGVAIVDPRGDAPALFDAVEDAAADIERVGFVISASSSTAPNRGAPLRDGDPAPRSLRANIVAAYWPHAGRHGVRLCDPGRDVSARDRSSCGREGSNLHTISGTGT